MSKNIDSVQRQNIGDGDGCCHYLPITWKQPPFVVLGVLHVEVAYCNQHPLNASMCATCQYPNRPPACQ